MNGIKKQKTQKISIINLPNVGQYYINYPEYDIKNLNNFHTQNLSLKLIIIGDPYVGKTALLNRIAHNEFSNDYQSTIGVSFTSVEIITNSISSKLSIWDMAGQESYYSVNKLYFRGAQIVFICFDLTNKQSFSNIEKWKNVMIENTSNLFGIFLVGCKSDLNKVIKNEEIKNFCEENSFEYFETSSKDSFNIENLIKRSSFIGICSIEELRSTKNPSNQFQLSEPLPLNNIIVEEKKKSFC